MHATGVPPASTRAAPATHCPVTHGGVARAGQGAAGDRRTATPMRDRRLPDTEHARERRGRRRPGPAWEQSTTAPRWRIGPGMSRHSDHRQGAGVDVDGRADMVMSRPCRCR